MPLSESTELTWPALFYEVHETFIHTQAAV